MRWADDWPRGLVRLEGPLVQPRGNVVVFRLVTLRRVELAREQRIERFLRRRDRKAAKKARTP